MGIRIGVANYASFFQFVEKLRPELPDDVELVILNDLFSELERSVKRIEAENSVDIFVASGGNADYLQHYLKTIPLVKVKVTGFDILNAVKNASAYSRSIAVITHSPIPQLDEIRSTLNVDLRPLVYQTPEELSLILQSLCAEGIRDVIGTALVLEQAKMFDMRGHFIWSLDGVRTALETAISMARQKKALQEKARTLDYLMDYSAEGIIVTDRNGIITQFNNSAERIMGRSRKNIIGRQCAEVLPNTQLHTVMREKRAQFNRIQDLGNVKIVTNRSPIICNKEVIGSLATFFSTSTIKQAGENIRRSQDFSGYIAKSTFDEIRTRSPQLEAVRERAVRYARSSSTILVFGETGSGKETFAQCLHNASLRKNEPFVRVNCAAIPASMLEGELFGYEEGFAGGKRAGKPGFLELAHQGTLFLDEVGDIPMKLQARLLSAMEEKQFFRVGGDKPVPVDMRIIAATNRDLRLLVREGSFREDLYYRINVLELHLPSLRERKCDIPLLIKDFLEYNRSDLTREETEKICTSPRFADYDWPGNIRELRNVIERFCVNYVPGEDIEKSVQEALIYENFDRGVQAGAGDTERAEIENALRLAGGSRAGAAKILSMSRTTLWRRMRELGMTE